MAAAPTHRLVALRPCACLVLWLAFASACARTGFAGAPSPSGSSGPDAASAAMPVLHLPPEAAILGGEDLVLADVVIDTDALSITGDGAPEGDLLEAVRPEPPGPEVAVLRAGALRVQGEVRAVGTRPLIIMAAGAIDIVGVLDCGAAADQPGAGGALPQQGLGAGRTGAAGNASGGGAGHAASGARGGDSGAAAGGLGGTSYGDPGIRILLGGSGGGSGMSQDHSVSGGAGGGAVQISSATGIFIGPGGVNAGGGGGRGGDYSTGGGGGGGSGGSVVLQAPEITHAGTVAANGGGGGSGYQGYTAVRNGLDGQLGRVAAAGGVHSSDGVGAGGDGGFADGEAVAGETGTSSPGGGGGAVGHVLVVAERFNDAGGVFSPDPEGLD